MLERAFILVSSKSNEQRKCIVDNQKLSVRDRTVLPLRLDDEAASLNFNRKDTRLDLCIGSLDMRIETRTGVLVSGRKVYLAAP
jgi:hypothetical protein